MLRLNLSWLVSKDPPKEAVDFMKVWLEKDIQMKLAAEGLSIPMVKGTADAIQDPFYKALALEVNNSDWICNAMDQLLGRDAGRVFNDEAAAVALGAQSPEQATKTIEDSWSKNRNLRGIVTMRNYSREPMEEKRPLRRQPDNRRLARSSCSCHGQRLPAGNLGSNEGRSS
jgi:hypothetical protein